MSLQDHSITAVTGTALAARYEAWRANPPIHPWQVPHPLQDLKRWMPTKFAARTDGGLGKPSYSLTTGRPVDYTNPENWVTFDQAVRATVLDGYDAAGVVLTQDDDIVAVDIDQCRNPATGEIAPWAWAIIRRLRSYSEVSRSGTGVHVFLKGKLPEGVRGRRRAYGDGGIELYGEGHYIVVTGDHLSGCAPFTVNEREEVLDALYDELFRKPEVLQAPTAAERRSGTILDDDEIIRRASNAKNGRRFQLLFGGHWGYEGRDWTCLDDPVLFAKQGPEADRSHSACDQALVDMLVYWCATDDQVDRIFRRSAQYRAKWDRPDYRAITIRTARTPWHRTQDAMEQSAEEARLELAPLLAAVRENKALKGAKRDVILAIIDQVVERLVRDPGAEWTSILIEGRRLERDPDDLEKWQEVLDPQTHRSLPRPGSICDVTGYERRQVSRVMAFWEAQGLIERSYEHNRGGATVATGGRGSPVNRTTGEIVEQVGPGWTTDTAVYLATTPAEALSWLAQWGPSTPPYEAQDEGDYDVTAAAVRAGAGTAVGRPVRLPRSNNHPGYDNLNDHSADRFNDDLVPKPLPSVSTYGTSTDGDDRPPVDDEDGGGRDVLNKNDRPIVIPTVLPRRRSTGGAKRGGGRSASERKVVTRKPCINCMTNEYIKTGPDDEYDLRCVCCNTPYRRGKAA